MHTPEQHIIPSNKHAPNSPFPILIYRDVIPLPFSEEKTTAYLEANRWTKRGCWGHIPTRHFHPNTHECYGIFRGESTLLLGCCGHEGDDSNTSSTSTSTGTGTSTSTSMSTSTSTSMSTSTSTSMSTSTSTSMSTSTSTSGGLEVNVSAGDVIVLPAGTAHCCLSSSKDYRYIGVYPDGAPHWRNEFGKEPIDLQMFRRETLAVEMPAMDPVNGAEGPLPGLWQAVDISSSSSST